MSRVTATGLPPARPGMIDARGRGAVRRAVRGPEPVITELPGVAGPAVIGVRGPGTAVDAVQRPEVMIMVDDPDAVIDAGPASVAWQSPPARLTPSLVGRGTAGVRWQRHDRRSGTTDGAVRGSASPGVDDGAAPVSATEGAGA